MSPSTKVLPFDGLYNWIFGIVTVNFDIDYGQVIEAIFPEHNTLTEDEKNVISYSSFPDSHSSYLGDVVYHYRLRFQTKFPIKRKNHDKVLPAFLLPEPGYMFAYVLFRQRKDESLRRNYFQKSVVVLSPYPFQALFYRVVSIVAPAFFAEGATALDVALAQISRWQPPRAGRKLSLPLLGEVLSVTLPKGHLSIHSSGVADHQHSDDDDDGGDVEHNACIPSLEFIHHDPATELHELDFYATFKPVLSHLQLLWELVITGQPVLVIGPSPRWCSQAVQGLILSIAPLGFVGDYRPFFTIHDPEYRDFSSKNGINQLRMPTLLGVTNPFFSKVLSHWPNIIRLDDSMPGLEVAKLRPKMLFKSLTSLDDHQPGLYSEQKVFLKGDSAFIKKLRTTRDDPASSSQLSEKIRQYFFELTRNFMNPLERYVSSLMPLQKSVSPFRCAPRLRQFDVEEFLESVAVRPRGSSSELRWARGNLVGLYRRFVAGPHFTAWLARREADVNAQLRAIHVNALCSADLASWLSVDRPTEVAVVDLVIQINSRIKEQRCHSDGESQLAPLARQLDLLLTSLPADLRSVIQSSLSGTGAPFSTDWTNG